MTLGLLYYGAFVNTGASNALPGLIRSHFALVVDKLACNI